ncbi:hypothetical protein DMA11_20515 [Marinilabiliaceae bacterium JC017]|nr:hypothetical protein DMA11_20515 [Marinilabiliaceae bacterium JC017]
MARNNSNKRRKKKTPQSSQQKDGAAQRVYLNRLHLLTKICGCREAFSLLTKKDKATIYSKRIHFRHPVAAEGHDISSKVLKQFGDQCRFLRDKRITKFPPYDEPVSITDLISLSAFNDFLERVPSKERQEELQIAFSPMIKAFEKINDPLKTMYLYYNFIQLMENRCDQIMYGFNTDFKCRTETVIGLYHEIYMKSYKPRHSTARLNGNIRPVYQLGWPLVNTKVSWQYLPVSWLGDLYKGDKTHLPICIQSHAINRLHERNDAFEFKWNNIHLITSFGCKERFQIYNNKLLFAYYYAHIKTGYFVADLVGNRVIIRTFLFATHHYTPEGNKLEELSGLAKEDVRYWQIDKLSTFLENKLEDHPRIKELFEAAGLASLFEIKEMLDHRDPLNLFNMNALVDFIDRGQEEISEELNEEQWEEDPETVNSEQ